MKEHDLHRRPAKRFAALIMLGPLLSIPLLAISCNSPSNDHAILSCSSSSEGEMGNDSSLYSSISEDGRYVAFQSYAKNLIKRETADDMHGYQVYRKDLETAETLICSSTSSGIIGDSSSERPVISADGRYIAFQSDATNLVDGDTNDSNDIFRKDLASGEIVRCSISENGEQGAGNSTMPSISADGRYVAFAFFGENLLPNAGNLGDGQKNRSNVLRKDLTTGRIACCSSTREAILGNGDSENPAISGNGRYAAFESTAQNLVQGFGSWDGAIFRKDLETGEMVLCSASLVGEAANDACNFPSINFDGQFVAFDSLATNLSPEVVGNGEWVVFRKDLSSGEIIACSTTKEGEPANSNSGPSSITADGRFVAFVSTASNLTADTSNTRMEVFRKDFEDGSIFLCSSSTKGKVANGDSREPSISADGAYVAFESNADNLSSKDTNNVYDIYRKQL